MSAFSPRFPWFVRTALALALSVGCALGQTAISSITTTFTVGTHTTNEALNSGTVTYDNDDLAIATMKDADGNSYTVTGSASTAFLRTDSTGTGELNQTSAWYMGNSASSSGSSPTTIDGSYNSGNPATLLLGNNILEGSDNVFINSSSTSAAQGDVERIDLIYNGTTGTTATSTLAIGVFDRGTGDSFSIAVITGVDSHGNPTSYGGNLVTVTNTDFTGGNLLTTSNIGTAPIMNGSTSPTDYLVRYDSSTSLTTTNNTADDEHNNQNITGMVFSMADLGITSGTKIYGYSLMAGDVTDGGNVNNLVNYSNSTYFPTTTTDSGAFDGLDPVAVNGVIFTMHPAPEPAAYAEVFLAACLALYGWRRARKSHALT